MCIRDRYQRRVHGNIMTSYNTARPDKSTSFLVTEALTSSKGRTTAVQYTKGRFLGKGAFASCYEFQNVGTREISAAKVISKCSVTRAHEKSKLRSEVRIHSALDHPNIVKFKHYFEDSYNYYMLLELCSNGTFAELLSRRRRLTEFEVRAYALQILSALEYLHANRVIHRDLKLSNLFLTGNMRVKVGDFGLAGKVSGTNEKRKTVCGTPNYIAPEVLEGRKGYSYQADIWSFGVVVYVLLIGDSPFDDNTEKEIYRRIRTNTYSFPKNVAISEEAKGFIKSLLTSNPDKRPILKEIYSHPFLSKHSIPKLMPAFTLHSAPSKSYIKEKMKDTENNLKESVKLSIPDSEAKPVTSNSSKNSSKQTIDSPKPEPIIYIKKWINCVAKYGICYLLSNGFIGIFFNDSTKVILNSKGHFDYIERCGADKQEHAANYTLESYPAELKKKITLLKRAKEQLENDKEILRSPNKSDNDGTPNMMVYLKKWISASGDTVFRLSNKVIQAVFKDNTELIINPENHEVAYIDVRGERSVCPSAVALKSENQEMVAKLKFTKEMLFKIASKKQ
eukprot:TRINITY_DN69_c0_g1_i5.p1 TRINITY_DN69_c0_g1~~TRINITY_DN69_c0_g1_i5.p1  ORF type:complete len:579 (-),score=94.39 TRINITY_DN69_c0_g1_i5:142-1833(-)